MNLYQPTITGSLSVSGSVNISGSITIAGGGTISGTASIATNAITASSADNFLVRNTLTAQTLVVQTITSSVSTITGSTNFGSLAINTHQFTGSILASGSVIATQGIFSGSRPQGIFTLNSNTGLYVRDATGTGYKSWSVGTNDIVPGFALTPSTTVGGTTFTTPVFVINESGSVGLGTISPKTRFQVAGLTGQSVPGATGIATLGLANSSSVALFTNLDPDYGTLFGTLNTGVGWIQQQRVDGTGTAYNLLLQPNGGNVGIGTSSPQRTLSIANGGPTVEIDPNGGAAGPIYFNYNRSTSTYLTPEYWALAHKFMVSGGTEAMRITSGGDININMPNSTDRSLSWYSANGVYQVAAIKAITDPSYNDAGILKFFTAGTSSSGMAERMRITSGGVLQMVGAGYLRNALQSSYFGYNGVYRTLIVGSTGTDYTTDSVTLCFGVDVSGNANGSFSGNGTEYIWRNAGSFKSPNSTNNNYNTLLSWNSSGVVTVTTSDYRAKEDLKSFEALPMVNAMKLYDFRWIELQNRMHGVLAHELQEIVPYAVIGEKDGGSMQGVDYSKLVPIMLKAIQEQQAQIEAQQQQINTLLNK